MLIELSQVRGNQHRRSLCRAPFFASNTAAFQHVSGSCIVDDTQASIYNTHWSSLFSLKHFHSLPQHLLYLQVNLTPTNLTSSIYMRLLFLFHVSTLQQPPSTTTIKIVTTTHYQQLYSDPSLRSLDHLQPTAREVRPSTDRTLIDSARQLGVRFNFHA